MGPVTTLLDLLTFNDDFIYLGSRGNINFFQSKDWYLKTNLQR